MHREARAHSVPADIPFQRTAIRKALDIGEGPAQCANSHYPKTATMITPEALTVLPAPGSAW